MVGDQTGRVRESVGGKVRLGLIRLRVFRTIMIPLYNENKLLYEKNKQLCDKIEHLGKYEKMYEAKFNNESSICFLKFKSLDIC